MNVARRRALVLALAAAVPAGCSLTPVDVEVRQELISKVPADISPSPTLGATLLVLEPTAAGAYDTARMAYNLAPHELAYYARTEWVEKPARMLRDVLVRTLDRTRRFRGVVTPPYVGSAAFALHTELIELRQDLSAGRSEVILGMRVELRDGRTDRSVATREFTVREPMSDRSPYAGAAAVNEAAARLARDIARFVVDNSG